MKLYRNGLVLMAFLMAMSSYTQAENTRQSNKEHPPRPTFESIDTNGDTDIDFDEFSAHEIPRGDHQTIFDTIDTDNNGVISVEEFNNHKPPHPPKPKGNKND